MMKCPNCGSDRVKQVKFHGSDGVNEYQCQDCEARHGN